MLPEIFRILQKHSDGVSEVLWLFFDTVTEVKIEDYA